MGGTDNHQDSSPIWDDDAFRGRVESLAKAKGRTIRQICQDAGLAADYLNKPADKKGRSIVALLQIARALGVSILDLIDVKVIAGETIRGVAPDVLGRLSLTAHVAAHLYLSLDSRKNIPAPHDAERIVRLILALLDVPTPSDQVPAG